MSSRPDADSSSSLLAGKLLLSTPTLDESIFNRAVILLAQHSEEDGAFGLILNQPSDRVVGDLLSDPEVEPLAQLPVFVGGPVDQDKLSFSALWVSAAGDFRYLQQISAEDALVRHRQPGTLVRAFAGYSGWSAGQLEGGLKQNSWMVIDAPSIMLGLIHDRTMWAETLRQLTPFHRVLAEFPDHPELN